MQSIKRMTEFNQSFNGDAKAVYKKMQDWYRANKPADGVFFQSHAIPTCAPEIEKSMAQSAMLFLKTRSTDDKQLQDTIKDQYGLHLFGTWRNTLGIYKVDRDILMELIKAPIPDDTPSHIFSRLPDWCVYVEIITDEEVRGGETGLLGFWALLDRMPHVKTGSVLGLHIVPHINHSNPALNSNYLPIQMALSEDLTVLEAIELVRESNDELVGFFGADPSIKRQNAEENKGVLLSLLPLLLWLCAEEPDISNIKGEPVSASSMRAPKYGINKKTGAFVPPNHPTVYHLGSRLGGELRQFNDKIDKPDGSSASSRKRPHIRRGHWHGVWRGTGQDKHFHLNWQAAIFVNGK